METFTYSAKFSIKCEFFNNSLCFCLSNYHAAGNKENLSIRDKNLNCSLAATIYIYKAAFLPFFRSSVLPFFLPQKSTKPLPRPGWRQVALQYSTNKVYSCTVYICISVSVNGGPRYTYSEC